VVADVAALKGSMGYWINNNDDYNGYASGQPPVKFGGSVASFVERMLAGRGLKISEVTNLLVPITDENLDQWADKSWNLDTPGTSEGPTPTPFMSTAFVSSLFKNPAPPK
jgi:hypothetical protein